MTCDRCEKELLCALTNDVTNDVTTDDVMTNDVMTDCNMAHLKERKTF
jgi:hypothetical protein